MYMCLLRFWQIFTEADKLTKKYTNIISSLYHYTTVIGVDTWSSDLLYSTVILLILL